MRIAIVSYMGYDGPGVMHAHHFANRLVDRGHEVLFLLNGSRRTRSGMADPPRYRLEEVTFRRGLLARRLHQTIEGFIPDIVHLWTPRHLPVRVGLEAWQASDARLLTAYGTLYRALARLEEMGLLESRWEDPEIPARENRPGRRLYSLTGKGEAVVKAHAHARDTKRAARANRKLRPA